MTSAFLTYKLIMVLVVFLVSLGVAMYSTYGERKIAAFLQDRIGPDRAGPFGILQPFADGIKMFFKEEFIPEHANKWLFILGPSLFMLTACLTGVVVPWGLPYVTQGVSYPMQITDINIGMLYVFGVVSIGVYGIMIGGWASNNKFALLGSIRASSQMISYEIAMGMSIIALIMVTGTLSMSEIVVQQHGMKWNVFYQPLAFLIFLICAFAETNRAPFDLPEAESELVGGYHTEYSSMKLGFYLFAEYINMFISSAIMSTLFFGGYNYPGMDWVNGMVGPGLATTISIVVFMAKVFLFIMFFMWVRWTLPRFRYDQLMSLGWKALFPLSILNIIITGLVMYFTGQLQ